MENELVQAGSQMGIALAVLGGALAVGMGGMGSSMGVSYAGQAGAGVTAEKPELFGKVLVLEALPATQGIYGFLIGFLVLLNTGVLAGDPIAMTTGEGFKILFGCLAAGLSCWFSGMYQGKVSAAGMGSIAKDPSTMGKMMVLSAMVETYAVLGFLVSALIVFGI
jgi:V/A-type H+/Na+-transporting ATPase subunit K